MGGQALRSAFDGLGEVEFHRLAAFGDGEVGVFRASTGTSPWERHPDDEELLQVLEGSVELEVLLDGGSEVTLVEEGAIFVVPRGHWHRHRHVGPVKELYVTPGRTETSSAEDPRAADADQNFGASVVDAMAARDWEAATAATRSHVPLHGRMGLSFVRVDEQSTVMTMELSDQVRGSAEGTVHGGILATFADVTSATSLVGSFDPDGEIPVTTDMHVRYYRQPTAGPLKAEATVVHRGRRLLSTECSVVDGDDRVLVRATATYMLVPRPF